ncbi:hypothetical protein DHEL01_v212545 [Diaporthe helianthi]|uniref:Uncharacterized protein n=1 Tax=Diaporthe helianthi TaxID=158607 RepID=A0A2P5HFN9_DIAHE|nr:hypothetical protein DHEL01_v212545 [Diaporthe helianthi]
MSSTKASSDKLAPSRVIIARVNGRAVTEELGRYPMCTTRDGLKHLDDADGWGIQPGPPHKRRMTSKRNEPEDAAIASTSHDSTEPSSSAEPAAVTRSLAGAMGGVPSSQNPGVQKGNEDGAKTARNSGKRRDKSKSVEPSESALDR